MQLNNYLLSADCVSGNVVMNKIKEVIKKKEYRQRKEAEEKGGWRGGRERRNDEDKRKESRAHGRQAMVIGKTSGVGHTVWAEAEAAFFWPSLLPTITTRLVHTILPTRQL